MYHNTRGLSVEIDPDTRGLCKESKRDADNIGTNAMKQLSDCVPNRPTHLHGH